MLGYVYYPNGQLPNSADTAIKIASSVGTVIGQLVFGAFSDFLGRKRMYGVELCIMIAAIFCLSLSGDAQELSIIGVTIFWRLILGIGIGGDYPSSSIITSEFATKRWRGAMMAAVFAFQGFGQFSAAMVSFIVTVGFKDALQTSTCFTDVNCQIALGKCWRILYGLGIIPAVIALYFRLTIPETIRYTLDVENDEVAAIADAEHFVKGKFGSAKIHRNPRGFKKNDFFRHFKRWKNLKILLGTALSWLFLDVAFYGIELNTSGIVEAITVQIVQSEPGTIRTYTALYQTGVGNLVLSAGGLIPGHIAALLTIDQVGRRTLQISGFLILTILFGVIGFAWSTLSSQSLVTLFCLCNFFSNFGPNTTTFIVPGEVFPTRYRSTAYGISAAAGKIGAILSQVVSHYSGSGWIGGDRNSKNVAMVIYAVFMFLGIFSSLLIPETKRKSLEEISGYI
jgi:MFS transporter, PHS family, inorganic phosphate transporter